MTKQFSMIASALVALGLVANADPPPPQSGHHHAPPPEAIAACKNLKESAPCTFTFKNHDVKGTCRVGHESTELACRPSHRHHEGSDAPPSK